MDNFIALVPLRGGSKSIPFKNIKLLNGKPLCYWMLLALEKSLVSKIYVATDSNEIKNCVNNFNFSKIVIYDRDSQNAQDTSPTEDVLLEVINHYNFSEDIFMVLAQGTSPLISHNDINNAINILGENTQYDSLLSGVNTKRFFWDYAKSSPINYDYNLRPRRQDFQGYFMENGAFYINKIKNILLNKNRLYGNIYLYEMPEESSIEIDEELDWQIVENIMRNKSKEE